MNYNIIRGNKNTNQKSKIKLVENVKKKPTRKFYQMTADLSPSRFVCQELRQIFNLSITVRSFSELLLKCSQ